MEALLLKGTYVDKENDFSIKIVVSLVLLLAVRIVLPLNRIKLQKLKYGLSLNIVR